MDAKLDKPSALHKRIQRRVNQLKKALGPDLSLQKEWLINDIAPTEILLDRVDYYLATINPLSHGKPRPAATIRLQSATHVKEALTKLGLERVKKPPKPW